MSFAALRGRPVWRVVWLTWIFVGLTNCQGETDHKDSRVVADGKVPTEYASFEELLEPFGTRLGEPGAGEWLSSIEVEGQSLADYIDRDPPRKSADRKTIYLVEIGDLPAKKAPLAKLIARHIELYYQVEVKKLPRIPLEQIPSSEQRVKEISGVRQLSAQYLVRKLLDEILPKDALSLLAITDEDLWSSNFSFVFGLGSLVRRTAAVSLFRVGDGYGEGGIEESLAIRRSLSTTVHELGHTLEMKHCRVYACNMNGSISMMEKDVKPLALGPTCAAKAYWFGGDHPAQRYRDLAQFYRGLGFLDDAMDHQDISEAIGGATFSRK